MKAEVAGLISQRVTEIKMNHLFLGKFKKSKSVWLSRITQIWELEKTRVKQTYFQHTELTQIPSILLNCFCIEHSAVSLKQNNY